MDSDFRYHDRIDRDVIKVSKDSLRLRLEDCAKYAALPAEVVGYGGIAITLLAAAFLSESIHNLWIIPGETVRSAFLVGGIVAICITASKGLRGYRSGKEHTPGAIIRELSEKTPQPIALLAAPQSTQEQKQKRERRQSTRPTNQPSIKLEQKL